MIFRDIQLATLAAAGFPAMITMQQVWPEEKSLNLAYFLIIGALSSLHFLVYHKHYDGIVPMASCALVGSVVGLWFMVP